MIELLQHCGDLIYLVLQLGLVCVLVIWVLVVCILGVCHGIWIATTGYKHGTALIPKLTSNVLDQSHVKTKS